MDLEYIAFDSMGVKSSCFQVASERSTVVVDPGVTIESDSFPLSESQRMYRKRTYEHEVKKKAKNADAVAISHYHYDHYTPEPDRKMYGRKRLLLKHPEKEINDEQRERAAEFLDGVRGMTDRVDYADGRTFYFDGFKLSVGEPMWHGTEETKMGTVVPMMFEDNGSGRRVLYTSDLEGPVEEEYVDWIVDRDPDELILNGFPIYMLEFVKEYSHYARAVLNLKQIIEEVRPSKIVLDHHLLRDYRYRELYGPAFRAATDNGVTMRTAAEEMGDDPQVVRAYRENGPTEWREWPSPTTDDLERIADGSDPEIVLDID
jgi:predicted metallo-beta-lactamase superfamily hydrolase